MPRNCGKTASEIPAICLPGKFYPVSYDERNHARPDRVVSLAVRVVCQLQTANCGHRLASSCGCSTCIRVYARLASIRNLLRRFLAFGWFQLPHRTRPGRHHPPRHVRDSRPVLHPRRQPEHHPAARRPRDCDGLLRLRPFGQCAATGTTPNLFRSGKDSEPSLLIKLVSDSKFLVDGFPTGGMRVVAAVWHPGPPSHAQIEPKGVLAEIVGQQIDQRAVFRLEAIQGG